MRIGLVIYGSLDTLSGGYLYDRKLVEYLRSQGDAVEIVSLPVTSYAGAIAQNASRTIRQNLTDLNVDVMLQDELNHPSLFWLNGWLRPRVNYPLIGIVHHLRSSENHPGYLRSFYQAVERRYLKSLDGFVFNSQSTRRAVAALAQSNRPFVVATPGGDALDGPRIADENHAHSQEIKIVNNDTRLEIIFVGNLIMRKGLHTLIAALRNIPNGTWSLRVVGRTDLDPGYTHRCRELASQYGLFGKVEFLGALKDSALVQLYQSSHLLVVPSTFEGFGIVYLEAMRWGVVPVASNAGGAVEIIRNGENGWLVKPGDVGGLAAVLEKALHNPEMVTTMSQAARTRYADFPTWAETAEKIRQFLLDQI